MWSIGHTPRVMRDADLPIRVAAEVGPGHLCLVGAGEYLPPMKPVDVALLALTPAAREGRAPVVVCLPTAAGTEGEEVVARWMSAGIEHFRSLDADALALRVIDRGTADEPELADVIGGADLVYLSGGKPPHLMASLRDTPAWTGILRVLARGGVVAGCSAGAMIMGAQISRRSRHVELASRGSGSCRTRSCCRISTSSSAASAGWRRSAHRPAATCSASMA